MAEMKKLFYAFALVAIAAVALVMTSCGDDEPENEFVYRAGIIKISTSDIDEIGSIRAIYFNALNSETETFTLYGNQEECDKKVYEDCMKAQKEIEALTWTSRFTFTVTQLNHNKTIYSFTYKPAE